jgi:hypothetical protein
MNNNPLVDIIDFIAPYDDDLHVLFLGDHKNEPLQKSYKKIIKKARKSLPGQMPDVNYVEFTTSELFRNKAKEYLHSEACILIIDQELSNNIIQFITHKLNDPLEAMLIDKFILQAPQDKFIFDVHSVDDDTLNALINILDIQTSAFNYYMNTNILAIWALDTQEFNNHFQL